MTTTTTTGASTVRWYSQAEYRGQPIMLAVTDSNFIPCPHPFGVSAMHHLDPKGRHYCPTGFVWCSVCGGTADEPAPHACTRWEQPWWDQVIQYLKVLYR